MTDLVVCLEIGERRIFVFVASEGLPGNKAGRGEREGETEEEKDGCGESNETELVTVSYPFAETHRAVHR